VLADVVDGGTLTLRLPGCLVEQHGKYLTMEGCKRRR
jgi:hypothetical protein